MGADLYLRSSVELAQKKYRPKFQEFVRKRDAAANGRKEYYQAKVCEYYDKMHGDGYFRDSYNDSNLLWKLGLDYWEWFKSHLDDDRLLHPDRAALILEEIWNRRHLLDEIDDVDERKYFEQKFDEFAEFLRIAIRTNEAVFCSI